MTIDTDYRIIDVFFNRNWLPSNHRLVNGAIPFSDDSIDRHVFNTDFHYRWYPLGRGLRQSLTLHGEIIFDFGQGRRDALGRDLSARDGGLFRGLSDRHAGAQPQPRTDPAR